MQNFLTEGIVMYVRRVGLVSIVVITAFLFFVHDASANTHSVDLEIDQNQYLSISDSEQVGLDLNSSFTLEAWVKLESFPPEGTWATIVGKTKGGASPDRAYGLYFEHKNGADRIFLEVHDNNTVGGSPDHSVPYTVSIGTWEHIAVTYNLSLGVATFFVNGTAVGTSSGGAIGTINNSGQDFHIGRLSDDDPYRLDGLLDEVRVWGVVRTGEEIQQNYQKELNATEVDNLLGYWNLNENTNDSSVNGNALTGYPNTVYSEDVPFTSVSEKTLGELLEELRGYVNGEVKARVLRELYLTHLTLFERLYGKVPEHVSVKHLEILKKRVAHDMKRKFVPVSVGEEIVGQIDEILELLENN